MSKVWFVTGSSRGLGRALVEVALEAGDRVVATGATLSGCGTSSTSSATRYCPCDSM
jgi:NAD(P)-dependent dehydrogenase (short-subunit alcohol dehydrogenase family)